MRSVFERKALTLVAVGFGEVRRSPGPGRGGTKRDGDHDAATASGPEHEDSATGSPRPAGAYPGAPRPRVTACEPPLLTGVRAVGDQRAESTHETCEPDQVDEWLDEHAKHDRAVIVELPCDDEQILPRRAGRGGLPTSFETCCSIA